MTYRWYVESSPQCHLTDANGKRWDFEMHSHAGPLVLDKEGGDPVDEAPGEDSPFWAAFEIWTKQQGVR